ncbi:hypothetical protein [Rhizobium sp. RCC_161_2]|uniref:hypothetical protein n=1 Tax=Rhizobium sp. RCC_161_2 TaxID=3239219 RepID=UPI0035237D00
MKEFDYQSNDQIPWREIPGGGEFVEYFGHDPDFHDAEIVQITLNRHSQSSISIHTWNNAPFDIAKHVVVTFSLADIADLQLENFSHQNVLNGLAVRLAPERKDRRPYYGRDPHPKDIEIELRPCFGLCGFIRARTISISFAKGKPEDTTKS